MKEEMLVSVDSTLPFYTIAWTGGHSTLRNLKLSMSDVDKGKPFAVGSSNNKVVLCFIWIFNP